MVQISITEQSEGDRRQNSKSSTETSELGERSDGISALETLMNFMKGMIGPGCLTLPFAFHQAGLWAGLAMVLAFGVVNFYCMRQLVCAARNLAASRGKERLDYGGVVREAFANSFHFLASHSTKAEIFTKAAIVLLQMGICSVFYAFLVAQLKNMVETFLPMAIYPSYAYALVVLFPLVVLNYTRTLRTIAVLSTIANVLMLVSFVVILQGLVRSSQYILRLPTITNFDGMMTAAGSILYAFEGQAMVLPMENKLRRSEEMTSACGVIPVGMMIVSLIYASSGFFGYLAYGDGVCGSVTQNLPPTPLYITVNGMFIVVVYLGFVVQQYVVVDTLWPSVHALLGKRFSGKSLLFSDYLFRTLLVALAMSMAIWVPHVEDLIALVGVTSGTVLAVLLPTLVDTLLTVPASKPKRSIMRVDVLRIIFNGALILLGLFCLVSGLNANFRVILTKKENGTSCHV